MDHVVRVHGHLLDEAGVAAALHEGALRADGAKGDLGVGRVGGEDAFHGGGRHHTDARGRALRLDVGAVRGDDREARGHVPEDIRDLEALVARRHGEAAARRAHPIEDGAEALPREILAPEVEERPVLVRHHKLYLIFVNHGVSP